MVRRNCALTDADKADIDRWLARAESELAAIAVEAPRRVVDTSSAVLLSASFKPGQAVVPASLTLYRRVGYEPVSEVLVYRFT